MIRQKYWSIKHDLLETSGPQPILDDETYEVYLKRSGGGVVPHRARLGERWRPKDLAWLEELLDAGASQVVIAAAFPHCNWHRIRAVIAKLRGRDFKVPGMHELRSYETYETYQLRKEQSGHQ